VFALIVALFYFVVQQLENNVIVPRLIGQALELPPILVMAGVIVGASVGGILGAFMAAPLIATLRIVAMYAYNKILGRPPFPSELAPAPAQEEAAPVVTVSTSSTSSVAEDNRVVTEYTTQANAEEREGAT
jgi:hypothetical protein